MRVISIVDFVARPGMSQKRAAPLLKKSQAGINLMVHEMRSGARDFWLKIDEESGEIFDFWVEKHYPLPAKTQAL